MSNIIRQKLIAACDAIQLRTGAHEITHVLYLPEDEIHELGLLYLNYLLRAKGEWTVYLGQSVPTEDLRQLTTLSTQRIIFITLLTTQPAPSQVLPFLRTLREILPEKRITFWMAGAHLSLVSMKETPAGMKLFPTLRQLISMIDAG